MTGQQNGEMSVLLWRI